MLSLLDKRNWVLGDQAEELPRIDGIGNVDIQTARAGQSSAARRACSAGSAESCFRIPKPAPARGD